MRHGICRRPKPSRRRIMFKARLEWDVVPVADLVEARRDELYQLYAAHYDFTDEARFHSDLSEKQAVILLRAPEGRVVGFSTQMWMPAQVDDRRVHILFSGDTIIHPAYWGDQALVRAWCRFAGSLKARCGDEPLYWF